MSHIMDIYKFFQVNGQVILSGLGGLYLFLLTVVKLTPTPKDDELLSKIYDAVHRIVGAFGVKK